MVFFLIMRETMSRLTPDFSIRVVACRRSCRDKLCLRVLTGLFSSSGCVDLIMFLNTSSRCLSKVILFYRLKEIIGDEVGLLSDFRVRPEPWPELFWH